MIGTSFGAAFRPCVVETTIPTRLWTPALLEYISQPGALVALYASLLPSGEHDSTSGLRKSLLMTESFMSETAQVIRRIGTTSGDVVVTVPQWTPDSNVHFISQCTQPWHCSSQCTHYDRHCESNKTSDTNTSFPTILTEQDRNIQSEFACKNLLYRSTSQALDDDSDSDSTGHHHNQSSPLNALARHSTVKPVLLP